MMADHTSSNQEAGAPMVSQNQPQSHFDPIPLRPFPDIQPGTVSLPRMLTPFIGREEEMQGLCHLLTQPDVRLVTVTGTGGIGKTRLAIQVGGEVAPHFPDGVWFVSLAPLESPDQLYSAIAQQIGVRESGTRSLAEVIVAVLKARRALLILDNFEHLIDAAPRVTELLSACPDLTILVTSRTLLRVTGERDFTVPVLELFSEARTHGDGPAEAIQLFADRAQAVRPDFDLHEHQAVIQEICQELDGLPLAIELAAARVRYLSPNVLLARLVNDRKAHFQLLAGGPRDAPARHRSLHDTIAWSYGLLDPDEQILFRYISVFSGGFTLDTAEAICSTAREEGGTERFIDVFTGVTSLVDKSLLVQRELPTGEPWFFTLVTVREYAAEQLANQGEEAFVRGQHARHYCAFAKEAGAGLAGSEQRRWLDRLNAERANLLLALTWFDRQGDSKSLIEMTWPLFFFWWYEGHIAEAQYWFDRALSHSTDPTDPLSTWIAFAAAILCGNVHDFEKGEELSQRAIELAQISGNSTAEAMAMTVLSYSKLSFDNLEEAARVAREAEALLRAKAEGFWLGTGLGEAGVYLAIAGNIKDGIALIEEALRFDHERGDPYLAGVHTSDLGVLHHSIGDDQQAAKLYQQSIELLIQAGNAWYLASPLGGLAALAAPRDAEAAARLIGYAQVLRERGGVVGGSIEQRRDARATSVAQGILGEERYADEVTVGRSLPLNEIVGISKQIITEIFATSPNKTTNAFDALSSREMEVLRLLVAGQSDREIGETLFISPRTASKHVANILAKLDVSSRAEAAVYALRNGLV
jgi:predicted ATPase/DNA-binding CsgD family transcriptional regulator